VKSMAIVYKVKVFGGAPNPTDLRAPPEAPIYDL
jgi:hypothetical protein